MSQIDCGQHGPHRAEFATCVISKRLYVKARKFFLRDRPEKALSLLQKALQNHGSARTRNDQPTVRDGTILLAKVLHELRCFDECRDALQRAVEAGFLPPDDPEANLIELWLQIHEGRFAEVVAEAGRHVVLHRNQRTPLLGEFLFVRGAARRWLCEYDKAREDLQYAHYCFRLFDRQRDLALVSNFLGGLLLQRPRYREAITWFEKSRRINESLGLSRRVVDSYQNIGIAYYKMGRYEEALKNLCAAADIKTITPDRLCRAKIALGNVYRLVRNFDAARKNLIEAYTLAVDGRIAREECLALEFIGDVYRDDGKPGEAQRYYKRGLAIARKMAPRGDLVMELLRRRGESLELDGQPEQAVTMLTEARTLAASLGDRFEEGVILRCLAAAQARLGQRQVAGRYIEISVSHLEKVSARHELAISRLHAARILLASGATVSPDTAAVLGERAWHHAVAAHTLFRDLDIPYWSRQIETILATAARRHLAVDGASERDVNGGRDDTAAAGAEAGAETVSDESDACIIAVSPAMQSVLKLCRLYAVDDGPVLITGETGTGKGLIANHLHALSQRRDGPFVDVNCAALPRELVESELFGHEKGSFTGADRQRIGKFEQARGGTLFLDEIGDMSADAQAKVLKAVEEGRIQRVGGTETIATDVRIIAATNQDLRGPDSSFRDDLYFRLSILEIALSPLRERGEDILPLLDHFLSRHAGSPAVAAEYFSEEKVLSMLEYPWPGNVREVIKVAHQAVLERRARRLDVDEQQLDLLDIDAGEQLDESDSRPRADSRVRLLEALRLAGGNKAKAARLLGVDRKTVYNRLKRYGMSGH